MSSSNNKDGGRASVNVSANTIVGGHALAARELAHACGARIEWVVELVEVGIVEVRSAAPSTPDDWRFESADLQCALAARRLERDFGVGLDAAALIIDLQREVRRLKGVLSSRGLGADI